MESHFLAVTSENLKLHRTEAYYYEVQHPEIFNMKEQTRIRTELDNLKVQPGVCLDIGSGTGNLVRHLNNIGLSTVACDLSRDMLKHNKAMYKIVCEAGHLPFKDSLFKMVTTYSVFHHLPQPTRVLDEVCRVTTNNSVLFFDHDFGPADKKLTKIRRSQTYLPGYFAWLFVHPKSLLRLSVYVVYGRRKHVQNLRRVNLKLTDGNPSSIESVKEQLLHNGFSVEIVDHEATKLLRAWRRACVGFT